MLVSIELENRVTVGSADTVNVLHVMKCSECCYREQSVLVSIELENRVTV